MKLLGGRGGHIERRGVVLESIQLSLAILEFPSKFLVLSLQSLVLGLEVVEAFETAEDILSLLLVEGEGTFVLGGKQKEEIPRHHLSSGNSRRGTRRKYFRSSGVRKRACSPAQLGELIRRREARSGPSLGMTALTSAGANRLGTPFGSPSCIGPNSQWRRGPPTVVCSAGPRYFRRDPNIAAMIPAAANTPIPATMSFSPRVVNPQASAIAPMTISISPKSGVSNWSPTKPSNDFTT